MTTHHNEHGQQHGQQHLLRTPLSTTDLMAMSQTLDGHAPSGHAPNVHASNGKDVSWLSGASDNGGLHNDASGERQDTNGWCKNRVLAALPSDARERLAPHLRRVLLHQNDTLHQSSDAIQHVYFIEAGMISLVVAASDGAQVEVAVVSSEGVVGGSCVLGNEFSFHRALVEIPGTAYRLPASILLEECKRNNVLQQSLHRHLYVLMTQASQAALCNRIHTIEERLSRWLLTIRDRIQSSELDLTHEFIAHMLGVRRTGVTISMGILQQAGLIDYTRGHIVLCDSKKLEDCACECYGVIREQFKTLEGRASA